MLAFNSGSSITAGAGATIDVVHGSIQVNTATNLGPNLELVLGTSGGNDGNITGSAALTVQNSVEFIRGTISAPLIIDTANGDFVKTGFDTATITGDVTVNSLSAFTIRSTSSTVELDNSGTITNAGTITLVNTANSNPVTLDLTGGGLIENTGDVNFASGPSGNRILKGGNINNNSDGTVLVDANTDLQSAIIYNNTGGTINVTSGNILTLTGSSIVHESGATTGGAGTLSLTGSGTNTLTLNAALTLSTLDVVLGASSAGLIGNIDGAGALTVDSNVTLVRGTISAPMIIGTGTVTSTGNNTGAITGNVTINSGGTLHVGATGGTTELDYGSGTITNNGLILLAESSGTNPITLELDVGGAGDIVNTGTIQTTAGSTGARTIQDGNITNSGTIDIDTDTTYANGTLINTGAIDVASGETLTLNGANITHQSAGTYTGTGTLSLTTGTSTLLLADDLTLSDVSVVLGGASAGQIGNIAAMNTETLTVENVITLVRGEISTDLNIDSGGLVVGTGNDTGTISGGVNVNSGGTLEVRSTGGTTELKVTSAINNSGIVLIDSTSGATPVTLDLTGGGSLTNNSGALLSVTAGAGGTRVLKGDVSNDSGGIINIDGNLNYSDGTLSNNMGGAVNVGAGAKLNVITGATLSNGAIVNVAGGELEIDGTLSNSDTLNFIGVTGANAVFDLDVDYTNSSTIVLTSTDSGNTSGLEIEVGDTFTNSGIFQTSGTTGTARTISGNLINTSSGTLDIDVSTTLTSGTLTNDNFSSTFDIASGATFTVDSGATLDLIWNVTGTGDLANSGTVNVDFGTSNFNSFTNNSGGLILLDAGDSRDVTVVAASSSSNDGTLRFEDGVGNSSGNSQTLTLTSGTLTNTGTIEVLSGSASNTINAAVINSGTLDVDQNISINFGASEQFVSSGIITIDDGATLSLNSANTAANTVDFQTSNSITITVGSSLLTNGADVTNDGSIVISGTLDTGAGDFLNDTNGNLSGSGTFNVGGTYTNNGTDTTGASPGFMVINSAEVVYGETSQTIVELGGTDSADYDIRQINGHFISGGTLAVVSWAGFAASVGDSFDIIEWQSQSGMFHEANGLDSWGSVALDPIFTDTGLTLVARTITHQGDNTANIFTGTADDDVMVSLGGHDTLSGGAGNDLLLGGAGDDVLSGGAGDDRLIGGLGTDTADYSNDIAGVVVDLANGTATDGSGGMDTLISIENVIGSDFDDVLTGNSRDNVFIGGAGADTFVLNAPDDGNDLIQDFTSGEDTLLFTAAFGFAQGTATQGENFSVIGGTYDGTNAGANTAHASGQASIIYSLADSAIYYDANGKDADGYTVVASLNPGTNIVADDIHFAA